VAGAVPPPSNQALPDGQRHREQKLFFLVSEPTGEQFDFSESQSKTGLIYEKISLTRWAMIHHESPKPNLYENHKNGFISNGNRVGLNRDVGCRCTTMDGCKPTLYSRQQQRWKLLCAGTCL
jgi:hypothetical protein